MKYGNRIKIVIFCLLLSGCSLATVVLPDRETSVVENRELEQHPTFTRDAFMAGEYQSQYEAYLNDQFFLRDSWVTLAADLQRWMGKKDINGVYLGKNGCLIEKPEESGIDAGQVQENIETLAAFLNKADERYGAEHVSCMMIPSKATVLTEQLPAYAVCPTYEEVPAALRDKLTHPDLLLDLQEPLKAHQREYIYYRTDHHWTTLGAYYAYMAWAQRTGQAAGYPLNHYRRETVFTDFYGTTYNKVHTGGVKDCVELFRTKAEETVQVSMDGGEVRSDSMYFPEEAAKGFNRYNVFFSKNTFEVEVTTGAGTGKTLLLMKDSFANCFVPFLIEDYDRIIMIDYRYGKKAAGTIMSENKDITDVLVLYNSEKFMQNTKLGKLADTRTDTDAAGAGGMEEFRMEDFGIEE